ncbi:hypothetical protein HDU76_005033, partial [Blyttiomyces sp. JEL0837]
MTPLEILLWKDTRQKNTVTMGRVSSASTIKTESDSSAIPIYIEPAPLSTESSTDAQSLQTNNQSVTGTGLISIDLKSRPSTIMRASIVARKRLNPFEFTPESLETEYLSWQQESFIAKFNLCSIILLQYAIMHTFLDPIT